MKLRDVTRADPWLAGILKRPVFSLSVTDQPLGRSTARRALEQIGGAGFCYAKVPVADASTVALLEELGFRLVDTAVLFERELDLTANTSVPEGVRAAHPGDRDAVVEIAGSGFRYSRFHADPAIDNAVANRLKSEWVANYFRGDRGDAMVVATDDDRITGFNLLLREASEALIIDLIAVAASHRGMGVAAAMIRGAEMLYGAGLARYRVGTQIANTPSLRLYEKLGFRIVSAQHVLHYHAGHRPQ